MNAPAQPVSGGAPRKALTALDDALAELLSHAVPWSGDDAVETVSTFDADRRVLAEDLVSELQVPPADNSAMDGYAVRLADVSGPGAMLPVSQRIAAGQAPSSLAAGTIARIFTGASVPAGADAVLMQEHCTVLDDGRVRLDRMPAPGEAIRRAGEDVARGSIVLAAGTRLGPAALGLAASIGRANVRVARRPRVALFSTGDELVMPGEKAPADMPPGAIYNSNRFLLRSLLERCGCTVTDLGIVPDSFDATVAALRTAASGHDLVLTSGGVSVGEEDHVKPAVQALGELTLWQMAMKPGKPFAYGRVAGAHFIGLPGNPVSSFVTFLMMVRPFLLKLQGASRIAPEPLPTPAHFSWPKADPRREFLRVARNAQGGLELFAHQGSGVLTSMVWGDGLVDNPPSTPIAPGDLVRFLPFSELLS
ncbi:molybdopterin molybdotransferase MoeA [Xylophilus sp. GOD-11R]|nr:gephyrin-like molybdotransferase Glp [Xylophilus sp. GOD-11R]WPB59452.1 molybdopterin molybdotransferase MoeA [Xylophilus sp. GOD-11R]